MECPKNKRGAALLVAVVLVSVMLFAALSLATISVFEVKIAKSSRSSNTAYQLADAGMEQVLKVVLKEFDGEWDIRDLDNVSDKIDETYDADGCDDGKVKINNFGSDPDSSYVLMFYNDSGDEMKCSDNISEIESIKSKGIYKQNARIVETSLTSP